MRGVARRDIVAATRAAAPLIALIVALVRCADPTRGGGATGSRPPSVTVSATRMTYGFATSTATPQVAVDAFRISRHPTTVGEYRSCVNAGACRAPESKIPLCLGRAGSAPPGPTYGADAAQDALPVTCETPSQAAQYCAWVGGALPNPEQWLLASRGPAVHRYSWGEDAPTCSLAPSRCPESDGSAVFKVEQHPAGASPFGVQDVLLTPRELIAGRSGSPEEGCGSHTYCVAGSIRASVIDYIAPVADEAPGRVSATQPSFGFRCVWEAAR